MQQWTISRSYWDEQQKVDFIQLTMTSSAAGWRRSSKALPRAKLAPKKGHGHWWSAASLTHYSFLNPGKTIVSEKYAQQINKMHKKLQHLQPAPINRKGSMLLHNNAQPLHKQHFKNWTNWAMKFCLIHHIHLTSHQPSLLQASGQLLHGEGFHNQQDAENVFQEFIKSRSNLFLIGKMCWL